MIAIVISSIILSFVGMSLIRAARINTLSEARATASNYAESKVEELRRFSFGNIASGGDTLGEFFRDWVVTDNMGRPRIKNVDITVEWYDSKGNKHNITYNTTFYRNAYPYK
jgi:hypothetical protein